MIKVKRVTTSPRGARQGIGNEWCTLLFGLLKFGRDWQGTVLGGAMLDAAQSPQLANEEDKGSRDQHLTCGQLMGLSPSRILQVMLLNAESLRASLRCLNRAVCYHWRSTAAFETFMGPSKLDIGHAGHSWKGKSLGTRFSWLGFIFYLKSTEFCLF